MKVGDKVLYVAEEGEAMHYNDGDELLAFVCSVDEDEDTVNLAVFDKAGRVHSKVGVEELDKDGDRGGYKLAKATPVPAATAPVPHAAPAVPAAVKK